MVSKTTVSSSNLDTRANIVLWCNGNIRGFDPQVLSSNLSRTSKEASAAKHHSGSGNAGCNYFFLLSYSVIGNTTDSDSVDLRFEPLYDNLHGGYNLNGVEYWPVKPGVWVRSPLVTPHVPVVQWIRTPDYESGNGSSNLSGNTWHTSCSLSSLNRGQGKLNRHIMTYSERQLVSFGNYLLKRYGVMVYSNDGRNTPIYEREVHDADLSNWKHENPEFDNTQYPSKHAIGDLVKVFLMPQGEDSFPGFTGKIIAVHFTNSKVKYDIELIFAGDFT